VDVIISTVSLSHWLDSHGFRRSLPSRRYFLIVSGVLSAKLPQVSKQPLASLAGNRETRQENLKKWMEESNGIPCKTRDSKEIAKQIGRFLRWLCLKMGAKPQFQLI